MYLASNFKVTREMALMSKPLFSDSYGIFETLEVNTQQAYGTFKREGARFKVSLIKNSLNSQYHFFIAIKFENKKFYYNDLTIDPWDIFNKVRENGLSEVDAESVEMAMTVMLKIMAQWIKARREDPHHHLLNAYDSLEKAHEAARMKPEDLKHEATSGLLNTVASQVERLKEIG